MSTATSTALVTSVPTTPITKSKKAQPTIPPPSPGTWRHPKFTEIINRQSTSTFSDRNLRTTLANSAVLLFTIIFSSILKTGTNSILLLLNWAQPEATLSNVLTLLRLLLLVNIVFALRPILPYNKKDEILDIPLTPSQRSLLGLPSTPSTTSSPTAGTAAYITPPRYRRSSGSFSPSPGPSTDRRSISANYSSSPLSTSRHTLGFSPSPAPASPSTFRKSSGSPLHHRAVTRDSENFRPRESFGSSTASGTNGLSRSQSLHERGARGGRGDEIETPSPPTRVKRSTGLNYKWLYEKGRTLPKSDSMQF